MEFANVKGENRILTAVLLTATGVINDKELLKVTYRTFKWEMWWGLWKKEEAFKSTREQVRMETGVLG